MDEQNLIKAKTIAIIKYIYIKLLHIKSKVRKINSQHRR